MMDKKNLLNLLKYIILAFVLMSFVKSPQAINAIMYVLIIIGFYIIITKVLKKKKMNIDNIPTFTNFSLKKIKSRVVLAAIVILALILLAKSIVVVPAGETGVKHLFGKVSEKELSSGLHLINPLAVVTKMSIRTQEYTMSLTQGEGKKYVTDAITSLTKEGLSVELDMTVLYRLQEDKASDIFKEVGLEYDEKIIRPTIRTSIRDIIAQYEAKDIYSEKRQEAAKKIAESIKSQIDRRGIVIEEVLLRNVALPVNLANAIQEKLQAEQEAEKYNFILEREKKEKERKIIEAEGQRDAQRIINESLTSNYLYFLYISQLKDREGTIYVPVSPDSGMPMFKGIQ